MPENFELKIESQIERLKRSPCQEIEKEVAQKRIDWVAENISAAGLPAHPSPRQAFETLFFVYMGLPADELPVISETADEIVWHSLNRCPTLEAAGRLGLDTRQVEHVQPSCLGRRSECSIKCAGQIVGGPA